MLAKACQNYSKQKENSRLSKSSGVENNEFENNENIAPDSTATSNYYTQNEKPREMFHSPTSQHFISFDDLPAATVSAYGFQIYKMQLTFQFMALAGKVG